MTEERIILTKEKAENMMKVLFDAPVHLSSEEWEEIHEIISDGIREVLSEYVRG